MTWLEAKLHIDAAPHHVAFPEHRVPDKLPQAKRSCRHCYGTGRAGTRLVGRDRQVLVCVCVMKVALARVTPEV